MGIRQQHISGTKTTRMERTKRELENGNRQGNRPGEQKSRFDTLQTNLSTNK
jgi:hypothetical protein